MIVKELLLNALTNAGHIHEGETAEADDLSMALRKFNFEMQRCSNRNLVTAFQKVLDIEECKEDLVIGTIAMKRGRRLAQYVGKDDMLVEKPGLVKNKDFAYISSENGIYKAYGHHWYTPATTEQHAIAGWVPYEDDPAESTPDIVCVDIERIITVMFRNSYGQWETLRFVPLSQFYVEGDEFIYSTSTAGENKIKLTVSPKIVGKDLRIIYNSAMEFGKFDVLDLPDSHLALMELAVTVSILTADGDSDSTRLNNYQSQLDSVTNDIKANSVSERRILRSMERVGDNLHSGNFIFRRR